MTGLERIALSAQGDLQRVLRSVYSCTVPSTTSSDTPPYSAYFARPITIALVYSHAFIHLSPSQAPAPLSFPNPNAVASASPEIPIVQTRQVHLQCDGKTVCTATSTVRITSSKCAHLFLEENYAIGQMFRQLQKLPTFELLEVGFGPAEDLSSEKRSSTEQNQLWRKYRLSVPDFECEILEVFPSRDMFRHGEAWLTDRQETSTPLDSLYLHKGIDSNNSWSSKGAFIRGLGLGLLLIAAFEIFVYRPLVCS